VLGHSRRKFHDIHAIHASPITIEAIARIGALYGIEEDVRGKAAELRCSVRQARARPLLDDLRSWLEKSLRSLSAKSETAGAIRYALSHWRALNRYVDDGLLEIDNSAAKRALRAVALGRKNYLFCSSTPAANELPQSTRWSDRRNSMDSIPNAISARS
jgi:transposase